MNINQDKLSILQKQFEGAANQFPEMVYYTAMLSVEDYKNHGHLTRNACFYEAENVSEVMKKKLDPWRIDFFGKEIHAWDDGRYDSPVIRDGPSNHYHWLVRPIGQIWDTLPAMQRIHTLTEQASIVLRPLYGTIYNLSRIICQPNYLSYWFTSMQDILIYEKHEYSFIQEELKYLIKEFYIAEKTQNVELIQKLLSERPPTVDGMCDVFLKSALVCTILIDQLRKKDADKPKVTVDDENINEETTPPKKPEKQGVKTKSPQFMSVAELKEQDGGDGTEPEIKPVKKTNTKKRPTQAEMKNRNRAVTMAAVELKVTYDRLPTVSEIIEKTRLTADKIYATAPYKEGKIAKKSAKLTTEMTGSSVTGSEQFKNESIEHSRANRLSTADQLQRDKLIDESKADDANDEKQHKRHLRSKKNIAAEKY